MYGIIDTVQMYLIAIMEVRLIIYYQIQAYNNELLIGKQLIMWVYDRLIKIMLTYNLLFQNNYHVKL